MGPGGVTIFELSKPADAPKDTPSRRVCFLIYWRKTSSSWLPQVPVLVMNSTDYIQCIAGAVAAQFDRDGRTCGVRAQAYPPAL